MKHGGGEERKEEEEKEGMQRRAEPAGAAEAPAESPGATRRPPGALPVPGGSGCEPRSGGEQRVRAWPCHPWVPVSVGDARVPTQVEAQVPSGIGAAGMRGLSSGPCGAGHRLSPSPSPSGRGCRPPAVGVPQAGVGGGDGGQPAPSRAVVRWAVRGASPGALPGIQARDAGQLPGRERGPLARCPAV